MLAVILWGALPVYWKQLSSISPYQILANRIIWSFIFVFSILLFQRRLGTLLYILKNEKKTVIFVSGIILTFNWLTYIYAVNTDHIIESSLGYYINPLLNILLGRIVLKETMNIHQVIALVLALTGVIISTVSYGRLPIISLILAITFSTYSLLKKRVHFDVTIGLTLETLIVLPVAIGYLSMLHLQGVTIYSNLSSYELLFLVGTGIITAIPLMLFAFGAKRVPLTTIGFIQYINPTISLIFGISYIMNHLRLLKL